MRRTRLYRFTAALLGALFALALGSEALAVHPCPMHDAVLTATMQHHGAQAGESAHAAGAHHDRQAPAKGQCCCPDDGCCSAALAFAVPGLPAVVAPVVRELARHTPSDERAPQRGQRLLPFPNGPPHAALA
jgi:hypothetical protein